MEWFQSDQQQAPGPATVPMQGGGMGAIGGVSRASGDIRKARDASHEQTFNLLFNQPGRPSVLSEGDVK